jgi:hypothetical protein
LAKFEKNRVYLRDYFFGARFGFHVTVEGLGLSLPKAQLVGPFIFQGKLNTRNFTNFYRLGDGCSDLELLRDLAGVREETGG